MATVNIKHLGISISDGDAIEVSYGSKNTTMEYKNLILTTCGSCHGVEEWKCYHHRFPGPTWCVNENIIYIKKLVKINKVTEVE